MKIAFVTDDGTAISSHFGRAGKYMVVRLIMGKKSIVNLKDKLGYQHFSHGQGHHDHGPGQHGFDPASQSRHAGMLEPIMDCEVVICGGMGQGAYASIVSTGKKVMMVNHLSINEALDAF